MNEISQVLNNDGCLLIEKGYYKEAVHMLKMAIVTILTDKTKETERCTHKDKEDALKQCAILAKSLCVDLKPQVVLEYETIQVCNHSFKFSHKPVATCDGKHHSAFPVQAGSTIVSKETSYAQVAYNCALALHLSAIEDGIDVSTRTLKGALQQYRLARDLLGCQTVAHIDTWPILVAALNNEAQIHYHLCQYDSSRQCLTQVQAVVQRASQEDANTDFLSPLREHDRLFFLSNISFYKDSRPVSHAA